MRICVCMCNEFKVVRCCRTPSLSLSLSLSLSPPLSLPLSSISFYFSLSLMPLLIRTCTTIPLYTVASKTTNDVAASIGNSILSSLQLNEMVAASGTGATAESLLQSVVNLVGAAQAVATGTPSTESVATATAEDTGKGV